MSSGWIKLHRILVEWEWFKTPNMVHFWIYCLLKANHEPKPWQGIMIERGQFASGRESLSANIGISERSVRTCIDRLKLTNELTTKQYPKFTVFTINSWEKYQIKESDDQHVDKQTTRQRPANDQQTTTNKNDKNENNGKNIKKNTIEIPDCLLSISGFESAWKEWLDHLAEKKKKPTSLAMKRQLDTLSKAIDPISVICRSIEKNWQGIFLNDSDYNQKTKDKAEYDAMREFADNLAKNDPLVYTKEELEAYQADLKRQREMLL